MNVHKHYLLKSKRYWKDRHSIGTRGALHWPWETQTSLLQPLEMVKLAFLPKAVYCLCTRDPCLDWTEHSVSWTPDEISLYSQWTQAENTNMVCICRTYASATCSAKLLFLTAKSAFRWIENKSRNRAICSWTCLKKKDTQKTHRVMITDSRFLRLRVSGKLCWGSFREMFRAENAQKLIWALELARQRLDKRHHRHLSWKEKDTREEHWFQDLH